MKSVVSKWITAGNQWVEDNKTFMDAYYAASRDPKLREEVSQLEINYIYKHLVELVGAPEAERILKERGYS